MATQRQQPTPVGIPLHGPSPGGLFARSPVPMLLVDAPSGKIVDANTAASRLLGSARQEIVGVPFQSLHDSALSEVQEHLFLAATCKDDQPRRRSLRSRDGTAVPVEVRGAPWGDRGATVALYLHDVRAQHEAERERNRLQSQLWMAQKHEAVGRLAAGIAHDFNNLLSMVMLTAQSLAEDVGSDAIAHAGLAVIEDAAVKARELTKGLLAFSGRQMLEPRPVRLNDVVEEMEAIIRRTLPESIAVSTQLADGATLVSADPAQMQQVLLNLVVNAREAMPGGGKLIVTTTEVEVDEDFARDYASVQPGPHVLLTVSDTGIGMDDETQARIFEPFFSTRERETGTGLGLATVYGIVKQSGGSIWVTSEPGFGTTFRVYLPRLTSATAPSEPDADPEPAGPAPRGSEHILLVEDDDTVRGLVEGLLRDLGYDVTATGSPEAALKIHEDLWPSRGLHPVDLLLTDIVMPEMSGRDLTRRLRVKREDLKVLFMSGYLDPDDVDAAVTGDPLLAKPFTRNELATCIRAVFEGGPRNEDPYLTEA